jgi:hypothetical protein
MPERAATKRLVLADTMNFDRQSDSIIGLTADSVRRSQCSASEYSSYLMQTGLIFAVPVVMPVMVAWLPIGNMPRARRCGSGAGE